MFWWWPEFVSVFISPRCSSSNSNSLHSFIARPFLFLTFAAASPVPPSQSTHCFHYYFCRWHSASVPHGNPHYLSPVRNAVHQSFSFPYFFPSFSSSSLHCSMAPRVAVSRFRLRQFSRHAVAGVVDARKGRQVDWNVVVFLACWMDRWIQCQTK